jgi:hypothetical protein
VEATKSKASAMEAVEPAIVAAKEAVATAIRYISRKIPILKSISFF